MQTLKTLQRELRDLKSEMISIENKINRLNIDHTELRQKKDKIQSLINSRTKVISISEHAVLRYLKRACGVKTDLTRKAILSDETKRKIESMGDGVYPIGNGLKIRVKDRLIITVI